MFRGQNFGKNVVLIKNTTEGIRKVSSNPGGIYCKIKSLSIGRKPDKLVSPYQEPFVPLSRCPRQRNQVNKQAFLRGGYPITRRLIVCHCQKKWTNRRICG